MQLSKLYSNNPTFKNITFNLNGLNVIYAEVCSQIEEKKNSHDLGKTKLAEIIDFMLLKQINKDHFLLKIKKDDHSIFHKYVFYLELYLNSEKYLTIKRSLSSNTKISFASYEQTSNGYTPPQTWVLENISLDKAKKNLSAYLDFDFYKNKKYDYRKSISYSLRTQDDFSDVYELDKFVKGKDINWKPFMFDLLGFKGELLRLKYENDSKIKEIAENIKKLKKDSSIKTEDRDEIVAEKAIFEDNFRSIAAQLDRFNFYEQDKHLIEKGILEIEDRISELNSESYQLNYEIKKLSSSVTNSFSFDIEKIKKIFDETSIFFPDQLVSDYDNLMQFNRKLTQERNKLLKDTLNRKQNFLLKINEELFIKNKEREELLINLTDTETFNKFKICQKNLVLEEAKILMLQTKLNYISQIRDKDREIESLGDEIKETITQLKAISDTTDCNPRYTEIRKLFSQYFKDIMNENAVLFWKLNSNNNVEFIPPKVKSQSNETNDTAKDEGNTYRKILCVAFDLAILSVYNKESYYRFVYHDDVLSRQDNGIKIRLLKLIHKLCAKYNIQYILSAIKSDLPVDATHQPIMFSDQEIVLRLNDHDATGTLFGFEF